MNIIDIILLFLFLTSQFVLFLFGIHYFFVIRIYQKNREEYRKSEKIPIINNYPKVTIQIPIYNEKFVIENVISNLIQLEYPKEKLQLQILDDSSDETVSLVRKIVAKLSDEGFNISHVVRTHRTNYKAGALNNGLISADGEYIAIFDADFMPNKEFLKETVPYFIKNENLGCIQTRWGHQNPNESLLTKCVALGIDGHFIVEQNVRSTFKVINFNGTCGIWKKECILDSGGWDGRILAEDLDLSYRAHIKGWDFKYLQNVVCLGEIPSDIFSFKQQQHRWAIGSVQSSRKNLYNVWQSDNFNLTQKIESTFHHFGYFIQFFMFTLFLSSIFLIEKQIFAILSIGLLFALLAIAAPSMYIISALELGYSKLKTLYLIIFLTILGAGLSYNTGLAAFNGLYKSEGEFKRTPKKGINRVGYLTSNNFNIIVEVFLGIIGLYGIYLTIMTGRYIVIPYITIFVLGFFWVAYLGIKHKISEINFLFKQRNQRREVLIQN
ncbi:MAG: Cellulose synthase catalytic subunit [UDP-forming] [Candidatus Heimdallarchaeota archaeon LC_3]|nr:MAG: Cellulose synthase catalytic subunit [UDP-forming] [Candidatus Heimdallarchaeota archaeon LC_3]